MTRPALLAALTFSMALAVPSAWASGAPDGPPADRPASGPHGDRNGDRVDDAFETRLRGAAHGERLAVLVTGLDAAAAHRAVGRFDERRHLPLVDGFSAQMTAGQARALARHPDVRRVEAVTRLHTMDEGTLRDFGATAARTDRPGLDGSGVGICVVDTGIDATHEQIAPRTVTFRDFIGTGTTAYDDHGHGTHVASIAAGDGTGGSSASSFGGVAPAADLYAAKVLDSTGYGENDGVVAGIQWCAAQPGVRVISMSLGDDAGGDGTDAVSLAVNTAVAGGDVAVVAAGNSGDSPETIAAPGTSTGALTVGAVAEHSNPDGTAWHDDGIWLAAFSSRGPTVDGRTKPDIVAPGVTVQSARANSGTGYVAFSGTSMATPFVAGAAALAIEARPSVTPTELRAAFVGTALDVGVAGADNEWGAGLVDVRAMVDHVASAAAPRRTPMPTQSHVAGTVPDHGATLVPVVVPADGVGTPIAVTVTLAGEGGCVIILGACWPVEWSPDLDVELLAPDGTVLSRSECALSGLSCGYGRQETVAAVPAVAGTYQLRIYTFEGGPDDGAGGDFTADISRGPIGTTEPGPQPNLAPTADAGDDLSVKVSGKTKLATFTLDGTGSTDPDGTITSWQWTEGAQVVGTAAQVTLQRAKGTHTFTLTVTDDEGVTDSDTVVVTVSGGGGGKGGGGGPKG